MAVLSGEKTLAELAAEFGVHPTMISNWKQELVKRAGELFARGSKAPSKPEVPSGRQRQDTKSGTRGHRPLTIEGG
jgi:transposase-like protein